MSMQPPKIKPSRGSRWRKSLVWSALVVVVILRIMVTHHQGDRFRGQRWGNGGNQERHPPTRVHPPVAKVPDDLWRIHIEIPPAGVEILRGYYWNRGSPQQNRTDVKATVREGTNVYRDVAIHLKGSAGSFRPFDDKPALTLNFSKNNSEQRFHGYSKISLNNSIQDPSYLCEALSREMFEAAGVPVPRSDHATVLINGRDLGLYVMTEGFGKAFLKRYFKNVSGNLYEGGFVQELHVNLDTNSGDTPEDRSDLRRLVEATSEPDLTNRWERLTQVLDMDRFVTFLAMEIMTCHWDGYALNRNNYRVFHDLETDRLVFMPHGMDQMFGIRRSSPSSSIQPMMQGMIARAVATSPQGRPIYLERIATLRTNVFIEEKLTNRVHELSRRIRPTLAAYAPDLASEHDNQVAYLCQRISERARSITAQLAAPAKPPQFDASGMTRLSGWSPRITSQQGRLQFKKIEREGRPVLEIAASRAGGAGSWRTRALLDPGQYRFEANVRTRGVGNSGGVCLRISGTRANRLMPTDNTWSLVHFNFSVQEPVEVELICELQAAQGEAWFDEESLKLFRE